MFFSGNLFFASYTQFYEHVIDAILKEVMFEWYIGTLLKQGWKYFSTSAIVYHIQHLRMRVFVQGFVLVGMWKYCPCFDTIPVRLCVHDSFLGHASGAQTTFSILLWRISTPVPGSRCGEIPRTLVADFDVAGVYSVWCISSRTHTEKPLYSAENTRLLSVQLYECVFSREDS